MTAVQHAPVKPPTWGDWHYGMALVSNWGIAVLREGTTALGTYRLGKVYRWCVEVGITLDDEWFCLTPDNRKLGPFATDVDALIAAREHHEKRVLSCLELA